MYVFMYLIIYLIIGVALKQIIVSDDIPVGHIPHRKSKSNLTLKTLGKIASIFHTDLIAQFRQHPDPAR